MISPTLPPELKAALDGKLQGFSRTDAAHRSQKISTTYRAGGGSGTIEAIATVFGDGSPTGGGGTISQQTPEPSTMLLSCLGLTLLGGATWRKRRQNLVAERRRGRVA